MFNAELYLPNLDLCKKLKRFNYPQHGKGFYWVELPKVISISDQPNKRFVTYYAAGEKEALKLAYDCQYSDRQFYRAPTAIEMLYWIPHEFSISIKDAYFRTIYTTCRLVILKTDTQYVIRYEAYEPNIDSYISYYEISDIYVSDALAKTLLWFIENGHIKFDKRG